MKQEALVLLLKEIEIMLKKLIYFLIFPNLTETKIVLFLRYFTGTMQALRRGHELDFY